MPIGSKRTTRSTRVEKDRRQSAKPVLLKSTSNSEKQYAVIEVAVAH